MLGDFYGSIQIGLEDKLGPVLFQLPARLPYNEELLQRIIESVDPSFDNVIEFRDESWWTKKVYDALRKKKISFCGISHPQLSNTVIKNTPLLYYRFHGVPVLYKSEYVKEFVQQIANDVKNAGRIKNAFIYFNNTWGTGGIVNAKQMQEIIQVL